MTEHDVNDTWDFSNEAIDSICVTKFDNTWAPQFNIEEQLKDFAYRNENNFHVMNKIPPESIAPGREDWDVEYRYNENWFRSDNFKKDHDGLHILYSGCSCTEGLGENIERTWTHILNEKIKKDYRISGYFNLGKGGNGWHKTITNYLVYEKEFGTPDIFFILMPNILRNFVWKSDDFAWGYDQKLPKGTEKKYLHESEWNKIPTFEDYARGYPEFVIAWITFLKYLKASNVKVIWSTWDGKDATNNLKVAYFLDTFLSINPIDDSVLQRMAASPNFTKKDIIARDNHPGLVSHTNWADQFLNCAQMKGIFDSYENYKINN
jgi:hypothetical protein